jgi:hypothetical protein
MRAESTWSSKGKTRQQILERVDNSFIRHRVHYERMMQGGHDDNGKRFRAAAGIKKVTFRALMKECEIVIDGSHEWNKSNHKYSTRIKFSNYGLISEAAGLSWLDKARLLLEDNICIDCDCAAYRYFYRYAATKRGFALVKESRPAKHTNPRNRGAVCKHLEHALRYIGGSYSTIASAMKRHNDYLKEDTMPTIKALVEGNLLEDVNHFGMVDVLSSLMVKAGKMGMSRTVNALRVAVHEAKAEGASPAAPAPAPGANGPTPAPAVQES